jgi:hypothetical protein
MFKKILSLTLVLAAVILVGCKSLPPAAKSSFCRFICTEDFFSFSRSKDAAGETVLLSPEIKSPIPWNQLIISWNAGAPAGTFLKMEACAIFPDHRTRFYTLGIWSPDNRTVARTSVGGQADANGNVDTDTLVLKHLAGAVQVRVTLGGTDGALPRMKFLGLSFANTTVTPVPRPPNRAAWGKIIPTPERSQHGYPNENGWCSPTSLSMVLARWAEVLNRPEMNLTVPEVAAQVYDKGFDGTGNWPFNTAFAGSFSGMRSYVTRFNDCSELEDWIAAGIPVIMSVRWDLLQPGRQDTGSGHLVVCIGLTKDGDFVINDPATNLKKESVRHVYHRENVLRAWATSHNTVYLAYPVGKRIP